ncbi:MAG: AmmeMemoRadiSam system protein B [Candidatus Dadabacteria bacterium]|nr:AmmeMemoRadiSam system protein B [Candidatus Dadabacteria bacterium]
MKWQSSKGEYNYLEMSNIRPSIGGQWYPNTNELLIQNLEMYLSNADVEKPSGKLYGIIVPHAGHIYSGQVAAHAFKCIEGMDFDTVIVVSPSHFLDDGNILTTSHDAYLTAMGAIEIDKALLNEVDNSLRENFEEKLVYVSKDPEHAIEVELPFLQYILKSFRLVPIMIFNQSYEIASALGHSLAQVIADRDALLVASSDLSHFYPDRIARDLDHEMLRRIQAFDPEGVIEAEILRKGFACGRGAISTVLCACRELGADQVKVLNYSNSGEVTGDYDSVVGYGAAVIYNSE